MTPNLLEFDFIVINSSAGKDSQAMLDYVIELADAAGFPRSKIIVAHADLQRMEWQGTKELAEKQASHYGLTFWHRARPQGDLLSMVRKRGKWPDSANRYCTSDLKRCQIGTLFTSLGSGVKILNCLGMRKQESPARSKLKPFEVNVRSTNGKRTVTNWLPIHDWTLEQVWERIRKSGVPHHPAYDLGMPRLSCVFCIFSPPEALMVAGHHNRTLLDEYVAVEKEIGHTFRHKFPIATIAERLDRGEKPPTAVHDWTM